MPSKSLTRWQTNAANALDEIEAAHAAVGGIARGRRYTTQQINQAYVMLISGLFQSYCRDLHSEAVDILCAQGTVPDQRLDILRRQLTQGRKLDSGNANEGNLGSDFSRLGLEFWTKVSAQSPANASLKMSLGILNRWRNAIAHQSFDPLILGPRTIVRLTDARLWRRSCDQLATEFDSAIADHLATITGSRPW